MDQPIENYVITKTSLTSGKIYRHTLCRVCFNEYNKARVKKIGYRNPNRKTLPEDLIQTGFKHLPEATKKCILEHIDKRISLKALAEMAGVKYNNLLFWRRSGKIMADE